MQKIQDSKKKIKNQKSKNKKLRETNRTQKTPDSSRCFLGVGTLYKADGIDHCPPTAYVLTKSANLV